MAVRLHGSPANKSAAALRNDLVHAATRARAHRARGVAELDVHFDQNGSPTLRGADARFMVGLSERDRQRRVRIIAGMFVLLAIVASALRHETVVGRKHIFR